ncbi:hypothetical protein V6N13_098758 [Hibiscus sabdariffa]
MNLARNQWVFHGKSEGRIETWNLAEASFETFSTATLPQNVNNCDGQEWPVQWNPPEEEKFKINSDASFCGQSGIAGIAAVVRNNSGNIIGGIVKIIRTGSMCCAVMKLKLYVREWITPATKDSPRSSVKQITMACLPP